VSSVGLGISPMDTLEETKFAVSLPLCAPSAPFRVRFPRFFKYIPYLYPLPPPPSPSFSHSFSFSSISRLQTHHMHYSLTSIHSYTYHTNYKVEIVVVYRFSISKLSLDILTTFVFFLVSWFNVSILFLLCCSVLRSVSIRVEFAYITFKSVSHCARRSNAHRGSGL
jgi:hypothetical protein